MKKLSPTDKKTLKDLNSKIKKLQGDLLLAKKREGIDSNIRIKIKKNQARFKIIKQKGVEDKAQGVFYLELEISAVSQEVMIPLSIASGKKVAGFMYQIEGGAVGSIVSANVKSRGAGVSQVSVGTLVFTKIPAGKTALFEIRATIRGSFGKSYQLVFTRINYKLGLAELRYQQYLKPVASSRVTFS